MTEIRVGDHVRHRESGWGGTVEAIAHINDAVRPTHSRPKEYADGRPVGEEWQGWEPITVGEDELKVIEELQRG